LRVKSGRFVTSGPFDYRPKLAALDEVIADIYSLTQGERTELSTWYQRHYPKLTGIGTDEG
jgi:hypothetical protein